MKGMGLWDSGRLNDSGDADGARADEARLGAKGGADQIGKVRAGGQRGGEIGNEADPADQQADEHGDAHRQALRYADELSDESILDRVDGMGITQDTEFAALAQNLAVTVQPRCEFQICGRARFLGEGGGMPFQGERNKHEDRAK